MDLSDKSCECDDSSCLTRTSDRDSSDASNVKSCVDCGTSKTPLWRGGPAGPKSLCNACGIKSRKKRRALIGGVTEDCEIKTSSKSTAFVNEHGDDRIKIQSSDSCTSSSGDSTTNACSMNRKKSMLWCSFGRSLQRPRSNTNRRRKMKEEEEAAFLLMALSSGSVYA